MTGLTAANSVSSSAFPICALPAPTVRALSSALNIIDPASAVKELVDNALDAGATSVAVELGPNTLEHVTVRDNGHSVPPGADRQLLGRRHCTSKLNLPFSQSTSVRNGDRDHDHDHDHLCTDLVLLRDVAGRSLGFRGEALASLAEVCAKVELTVRCEGEECGEVLRLGSSDDGVVGVSKVGCPVGTTVRAEGLLDKWPVRRQAALRDSNSAVRKIRRLLHGYALARPACRLSLKMSKGKGKGKEDWTYTPRPAVGQRGSEEKAVLDAVRKVAGNDAAAQCGYATRTMDGYAVEACLPRADAEGKMISGLGQFLSVDARPVSTAHGTLKLIAKAFRDALKKANPALGGIKQPFLRMDIACPPGSYDPNVEPSKTDLLFDDPGRVLGAVGGLLAAFYSSRHASVEAPATNDSDGAVHLDVGQTEKATAIQSSDARVSDCDDAMDSDLFDAFFGASAPLEEEHESEHSRPKRQRTWKHNMFDFDDDELLEEHVGAQPGPDANVASEDTEDAVDDITVSNPWTMAKITARIRGPDFASSTRVASTPSRPCYETQLPTPQASSSPIRHPDVVRVQVGRPNKPTRTNYPLTPSSSIPFSQAVDDDGFVPVPPRPVGNGTLISAKTAATRGSSRRGGPHKRQAGRGVVNRPFKSPVNPDSDNRAPATRPQHSKRSFLLLKRNEIPASNQQDDGGAFTADSGFSDGRDRDIRTWMATKTRRAPGLESDARANVPDCAEAMRQNHMMRMHDLDLSTQTRVSRSSPPGGGTQGRLTLRNRPSAAPPNLALEHVPEAAQMQNMSITLPTTNRTSEGEAFDTDSVTRTTATQQLRHGITGSIGWDTPNGLCHTFAANSSAASITPEVVQYWADQLGRLLTQYRPADIDGDMVPREDLSFIVMDSVQRHMRELVLWPSGET